MTNTKELTKIIWARPTGLAQNYKYKHKNNKLKKLITTKTQHTKKDNYISHLRTIDPKRQKNKNNTPREKYPKHTNTSLHSTPTPYKRTSQPQIQSTHHKQKLSYKKLPPQPPLILSNNTQIHNLNQITHTTNTHPNTHKVKTAYTKNKSIKPNSIPNKYKHTQTPHNKHAHTTQNTQNGTNNPTLKNNKPKQTQTPKHTTTTNSNYNKYKTSLNPYVQKTNHTKHLKRTRPTGLVPNQIKTNKTKHNNKTHKQPTKHPNHITYLDHKTLKITNNQRRIIYKNYTKPNITYTFPSHFIFLLSGNIETLLIHKIQKSIRENTTKLNNTPKTTHHNTTPTPINNLSKHQDKQTQHITHKCHLKRARPTGLAHKQKNKTKRHHPHKNTHAKTTKKKITKKQPSLINTLEQNIITNMNNKRKNKYHKQKKIYHT